MKSILGLLFLIVFTTSLDAQDIITNAEYGFSFKAPDSSWQPISVSADPHGLYGFFKNEPNGARLSYEIEKLGGTIGLEPLRDEDLKKSSASFPANSDASVIEGSWKAHKIYGMKTIMTVNGQHFLVELFQVPLYPMAIQVMSGGPTDEETQIRSNLDQMISGLDGKPIWEIRTTGSIVTLTPTERIYLLFKGLAQFLGILLLVSFVSKALRNRKS